MHGSSYIDCPVREPIQPAPHPRTPAPKQRTEEAWNGILKATTHHPNAGEDQTAETDDSTGIDGERFECPHERLSAGEVHRSLGMGNARECERKEGGSHHAESVGEKLSLKRVKPCDWRGGLDGLEHCFGGSLATSSNDEFSCDSQTLWAAQAPRPMTSRSSLMRSAHKCVPDGRVNIGIRSLLHAFDGQ